MTLQELRWVLDCTPLGRLGGIQVDHAFEEQAQPCKASEAMRHAIMADAEKPSGDNRVIQSLWIGDTLSSLEHCAIKSWLAHGHEVRPAALQFASITPRVRASYKSTIITHYSQPGVDDQVRRSMFEEWDARQLMPTQVHLYTFNPALRHVPDGVVLKDAEVIISNDTVKRKYNHVQTFADLFRYEMLRALGGWWVDLDLILLRPLTHLHPYCFAMELEDGIPKVSLETSTRLDAHRFVCTPGVRTVLMGELAPVHDQYPLSKLHDERSRIRRSSVDRR
jgi:hypothetical protein